MTDVEIINRELDKLYGHDLLGRPTFRLTFSEKEHEKRLGEHVTMYGHVFVRSWVGVRDAPKYAYLEPQWILEKLVFMPVKELVESNNGHYECIYGFRGLKPHLWVCQVIIRQLLFGSKFSKDDWEKMDKAEKDRYKSFVLDHLDNQASVENIMSKLGETVFPAVKQKEGTEISR